MVKVLMAVNVAGLKKKARPLKRKLPKEQKDKPVTIITELVGIKNLKTTHNWRLEFDVYEIDSSKVKELMDKLNKPLAMALVDYE